MSRRATIITLCIMVPVGMAIGITGVLFYLGSVNPTMAPLALMIALVLTGGGMHLVFSYLLGRRRTPAQ